MQKNNSLAEISAMIRSEASWTIVGHTIPDGDCVGSVIAINLALLAMGKRSVIVLEDPAPSMYRYLFGYDCILKADNTDGLNLDNIIFLDSAEEDRIGDRMQKLVKERRKSINIDHHYTNTRFADLNYVDSGAAATGQIIYDLLKELCVPVDFNIANALYAALVMDTGNFKNANTDASCFRLAADLVDCGASISQTRLHLFESKDIREMHMIRMTLDTIQFSPGGKVAWAEIPFGFVQTISAEGFHPEGIVNYVLMSEGVEVALLFRETAPGRTKISLRSKNGIDVARLAANFGGGGHAPAAGARVDEDIASAKKQVLDYIIGKVETISVE